MRIILFSPQVHTGVKKYFSTSVTQLQLNFKLLCTPMDKCASQGTCPASHLLLGRVQAGTSCRDGPQLQGP